MGKSKGASSIKQSGREADIPDWYKPYVERGLTRTEEQYGQPHQPYEGQRLAGADPSQTAALAALGGTGAGSIAESAQAGLTEGMDLLRQGTRGTTDQAEIQSHINPYLANVTNIAQRKAIEESQRQSQRNAALAAQSGAFGGTRGAVVEGMRMGKLGEQIGDIQSKGLAAAYEDAQRRMAQERGRQLQAAPRMGQIGVHRQKGLQEGYRGALAAGAQRRDIAQEPLDVAYQSFLEQREYPRQQLADYMGGIQGLAPRNVIDPYSYQDTSRAYKRYTPFQQFKQAGSNIMGAKAAGWFGAGGGQVPSYAGGGQLAPNQPYEEQVGQPSGLTSLGSGPTLALNKGGPVKRYAAGDYVLSDIPTQEDPLISEDEAYSEWEQGLDPFRDTDDLYNKDIWGKPSSKQDTQIGTEKSGVRRGETVRKIKPLTKNQRQVMSWMKDRRTEENKLINKLIRGYKTTGLYGRKSFTLQDYREGKITPNEKKRLNLEVNERNIDHYSNLIRRGEEDSPGWAESFKGGLESQRRPDISEPTAEQVDLGTDLTKREWGEREWNKERKRILANIKSDRAVKVGKHGPISPSPQYMLHSDTNREKALADYANWQKQNSGKKPRDRSPLPATYIEYQKLLKTDPSLKGRDRREQIAFPERHAKRVKDYKNQRRAYELNLMKKLGRTPIDDFDLPGGFDEVVRQEADPSARLSSGAGGDLGILPIPSEKGGPYDIDSDVESEASSLAYWGKILGKLAMGTKEEQVKGAGAKEKAKLDEILKGHAKYKQRVLSAENINKANKKVSDRYDHQVVENKIRHANQQKQYEENVAAWHESDKSVKARNKFEKSEYDRRINIFEKDKKDDRKKLYDSIEYDKDINKWIKDDHKAVVKTFRKRYDKVAESVKNKNISIREARQFIRDNWKEYQAGIARINATIRRNNKNKKKFYDSGVGRALAGKAVFDSAGMEDPKMDYALTRALVAPPKYDVEVVARQSPTLPEINALTADQLGKIPAVPQYKAIAPSAASALQAINSRKPPTLGTFIQMNRKRPTPPLYKDIPAPKFAVRADITPLSRKEYMLAVFGPAEESRNILNNKLRSVAEKYLADARYVGVGDKLKVWQERQKLLFDYRELDVKAQEAKMKEMSSWIEKFLGTDAMTIGFARLGKITDPEEKRKYLAQMGTDASNFIKGMLGGLQSASDAGKSKPRIGYNVNPD